MYFAVATYKSVFIFGTHLSSPIAMVGHIHLAGLTDVAWNEDKRLLVSSMDGYVSVVTLKEGQLGRRLSPEEVPENIRASYQARMEADYE